MIASAVPYDHETADAMPSPTEETHPSFEKRAPRPGQPRGTPEEEVHAGVGWPVVIYLCHAVSYDVNTILLQYAPNLLNIIHIHASNADAALEIAFTVLNDFELKRDTVQAENDFPAQ